jgi:ribonuclease H2 subunit A
MSVCEVDKDVPYALGIDEAGRGPVLGPMVYACAYCPVSEKDNIRSRGFMDSKQLSERQRETLFQKIVGASDVGFEACILSAEDLSNKMLRATKYNLNQISHDTAAELIQRALAKGVPLKEVYVDTVGDPAKYQATLSRKFPRLDITVSKKADDLFPVVSAASIVAKVIRDHCLRVWRFKEDVAFTRDFGSGYPADPVTKTWLVGNLDKLFGYPTLIRFSWATTDNMLEEFDAHAVAWEAESQDDGKGKKGNKQHRRTAALVQRATYMVTKSDRWAYYAKRGMRPATTVDF